MARPPDQVCSVIHQLEINCVASIGTIRDDDAVAVEEKRPAQPVIGLRPVDAEPASWRFGKHDLTHNHPVIRSIGDLKIDGIDVFLNRNTKHV